MPWRRVCTLFAGFAAVVLAMSACSNTTASVNRRPHTGTATATIGPDGVQQVTIEATDTFRFVPSTFYVHPGKVRVTLVHVGTQAPHDWQVTKYPSDYVPLLHGQGQQASTTFIAPSPGRYQYVCTIHASKGQTGTMVVLPS